MHLTGAVYNNKTILILLSPVLVLQECMLSLCNFHMADTLKIQWFNRFYYFHLNSSPQG